MNTDIIGIIGIIAIITAVITHRRCNYPVLFRPPVTEYGRVNYGAWRYL